MGDAARGRRAGPVDQFGPGIVQRSAGLERKGRAGRTNDSCGGWTVRGGWGAGGRAGAAGEIHGPAGAGCELRAALGCGEFLEGSGEPWEVKERGGLVW